MGWSTRRNQRRLELSFHKASKRWYKTIRGREVYFGKGRGVSDRDSYRAAVKAYRAYQDAEAIRVSTPQKEDYPTQAAYHSALMKAAAPILRAEYEQRMKRIAELETLTDGVTNDEDAADAVRNIIKMTPRRQRASIETVCDKFLADCERRYKLTESDPKSVGPKQGMSYKQLKNYRSTLAMFQRCAESVGRKTLGTLEQTEHLLEQYRDYMTDLVLSGDLSRSTFNGYSNKVKTMIRWAARHRLIDGMPLNIGDVFSNFTIEPKPKPLPLATVAKLWRSADSRMRCYMVLGLNSCAYASEIGQMTDEDIFIDKNNNTYIASHRGKTRAPYKHFLWEETKKLIGANRNSKGILFNTRKGGNVGVWGAIGQAFTKLRDEVEIEENKNKRTLKDKHGLPTFSRLRDTVSTMVERIGERVGNDTISSMVLAHRDNRTARYYVGKSPRQIDSTALDAALKEIERVFQVEVF